VVEGLVSLNCVSALVANAQQQKAALWLWKRYLSNNFVKCLLEKVFTNRADTLVTSLSLKESGVEGFPKAGHIRSGSLLVGHILDEVLVIS